jgi:LPXTG-motif cell wall-anchored protein
MRKFLHFVPALMLVVVALPAAAEVDIPNLKVTAPTVVGTTTATTSHSITVQSIEGETMSFDVDSRTVMPLNLMDGAYVRVEFHTMDNGNYLAKRVTPLTSMEVDKLQESGVLRPQAEVQVGEHNEMYAENTMEHPEGYGDHRAHAETEAHEQHDQYAQNEPTTTTTETHADESAMGEERTEQELPRTGSYLPALAGLALVTLALGAWLMRRRTT